MATREQFVEAVLNIWKNHGVYIWGGNGEYTQRLTIKDIQHMEDSDVNRARVLRYIALCYDRGYTMIKSRAVDCSGLAVAALRDIKAIGPTDDFRAKDLQAMGSEVKLSDLKPGDMVFNKMKDSSHCGIYIGDGMTIESQGRDYGVTKNRLSDRGWMIGGSLPYFK